MSTCPTKPDQFCAFGRSGGDFQRLNPAAKHLDLENQKLHPGVVPGHEKMREKGQEREKKVRIHGFSNVVLSSCIFSHLSNSGRFWISAPPSLESKKPSVGKIPGKIKVKRGVEVGVGQEK